MDAQTLGHNLFMFKQECDNMAYLLGDLLAVIQEMGEFLDHKAGCAVYPIFADGSNAKPCSCGLEQALALAAPLMNVKGVV